MLKLNYPWICAGCMVLLLAGWNGALAQEDAPAPSGPAPVPVAQDAAPGEDQAIRRRLREIFDNLEGLAGVRIEVRAGVVALSGEVLSAEARQQALAIARRVQGVVEVQDQLADVRDVQRRLTPAWEKLRARSLDFLNWLPLLLVAGLVLLAFWLLARLLAGWQGLYRWLTPNPFLGALLAQVVRSLVLLAGVLLVLEILDATALFGTVLGAAGVLGLALGFALRDTVENYIASLLLSLRQPFSPNDQVLIEGYEGRVVALTTRATVLMTLDGNHVRIPNAKVFSAIIVNYTRNPKRRFDFRVGVDVADDLVLAQTLAVETLDTLAGVLAEPPPASWIESLGDSNVLLWVGGWVDQDTHDFARVRSEAIRQVKRAFEEANIRMPEPLYNLRLLPATPLMTPARPAPTQPAAPTTPAIDIARDTHLDRQVAADRADAGPTDLLQRGATKE